MSDARSSALCRVLVQQIESLQRAGVTHLRRSACALPSSSATSGLRFVTPAMSKPVVQTGSKPSAPSEQSRPVSRPHPTVKQADAGRVVASAGEGEGGTRAGALAVIRKKVAACMRCSELCTTRTQTVFGDGNLTPRLVFLGEAPGADEDAQGVPFVGAAGQLLTKIIEAMGLQRRDVYILNILKCRPPGNRTPLPVEAAACREFLDGQLAVLQPEFICCLGACAAQNLLGTTRSIGQLRGKFVEYQTARVLCTYHPAYLLRQPSAKKQVWDDIQILMAEMGLERKKSH